MSDWQVSRHGERILLGLAVPGAVLDVFTDEDRMRQALQLLETPQDCHVDVVIGAFGPFPITLNVHRSGEVSLFVDGPTIEPSREVDGAFDAGRVKSAAIWVDREWLSRVIREALEKELDPEQGTETPHERPSRCGS